MKKIKQSFFVTNESLLLSNNFITIFDALLTSILIHLYLKKLCNKLYIHTDIRIMWFNFKIVILMSISFVSFFRNEIILRTVVKCRLHKQKIFWFFKIYFCTDWQIFLRFSLDNALNYLNTKFGEYCIYFYILPLVPLQVIEFFFISNLVQLFLYTRISNWLKMNCRIL